MTGEYFYRLSRNCVESIILLAACLWLMPIFLYVFGIEFLDILTIFSFTPFAISCGIFASKTRSSLLKFIFFLLSAGFAVILALVFNIGEIALGFGVVLSALFFIKQVVLPRYAVPGMRLAPLLVIACIFFLIASLMFSRPELSKDKWIVELLSIITVFAALILICCERVLMSGWYVNTRIPINNSVKKRNIVYIAVFAVLVLFFANFVVAFAATSSLAQWLSKSILYLVGAIFSVFSGIDPDSYISNPGNTTSGGAVVKPGHTDSANDILSKMDSSLFIKIVEGIAILIIIAGIVIFIVGVIKASISSYKKRIESRKSLITDMSVSDIEDFIEGDSVSRISPFSKLSSLFKKQEKYSELSDNIARTRFIYKKGLFSVLKDSPVAYTPRDNCKKAVKKGVINDEQSQALIHAYEKARYGNITPSDEEVTKIKSIL